MIGPRTTPLEEELDELEVALRQLKQQYDIFFSGAAARQPFETRKNVDLMVKRLGSTRMQRFSDRYRYNSLANKYQTYCELWAKNLRMQEEGFRPGTLKASIQAAAPAPSRQREARPRKADTVVFKSSFNDPTAEDDAFKSFYDKYLETRRARDGKSSSGMGYSTFLKTIAQKTEAIKAKSGCDRVNYSIVVKDDGVVALKAAPIKEKKK